MAASTAQLQAHDESVISRRGLCWRTGRATRCGLSVPTSSARSLSLACSASVTAPAAQPGRRSELVASHWRRVCDVEVCASPGRVSQADSAPCASPRVSCCVLRTQPATRSRSRRCREVRSESPRSHSLSSASPSSRPFVDRPTGNAASKSRAWLNFLGAATRPASSVRVATPKSLSLARFFATSRDLP